jgi:hypothetical protein
VTEGMLAVLRKCTGLKRFEVHGYFMQNINDRCVLLGRAAQTSIYLCADYAQFAHTAHAPMHCALCR